jgi:hypothetical protein
MKDDAVESSRLLFALLLSIGSLCYLLGLLMVDVSFDFLANNPAIVSYYCSLSNSFKSVSGISRILVPVSVSGTASTYLALRTPRADLMRLGQLVTCLMSVVGLPSLFVSILSCIRDCDRYNDLNSLDLLRAIHAVMGCLLVFAICVYSCILSKLFYLVSSR